MTVGQIFRRSYREFQQSWDRMADSAFGKAATPSKDDDTARGEFISDFITDRGLNLPKPDRRIAR